MTKRKALGSGLDSLLSSSQQSYKQDRDAELSTPNSIPVHKIIRNRYQPRKIFKENEIQKLANSIKNNGQIAPIVVRKIDDKYELVVGERRWRATQLLKKDTISAIVIEADEKTSAVLSIVEIVQREDLNPIEEAESLLRLVDDFEMSHDDIAEYISKSRAHVTNLIRLNDLSEYGKELLREEAISMGHARAVLTLSSDEQTKILKDTIKRNLSVRAVENLANPQPSNNKINKDPDTAILERQLSDVLGAKTNIKHSRSGGVINIRYKSINELQGIIEKIRNSSRNT